MRAFKRDTIQGFSSRGIRMAKGQSFRPLTLLNEKSFFGTFNFYLLVVFMPLEENPYIVLHLEALISGQKSWDLQRCSSTISLSNTLLKISILLHKSGIVQLQKVVIVCTFLINQDSRVLTFEPLKIIKKENISVISSRIWPWKINFPRILHNFTLNFLNQYHFNQYVHNSWNSFL